jgi:hypothetical protein
MVRFAETFPDTQILQTLSGELGWSHIRLLIYLDDVLKRDFYAGMFRLERSIADLLKSRHVCKAQRDCRASGQVQKRITTGRNSPRADFVAPLWSFRLGRA